MEPEVDNDPLQRLIEALLAEKLHAERDLLAHLTSLSSVQLLELGQHESSAVREVLAQALATRNEFALVPLGKLLAADKVEDVVIQLAQSLSKAPRSELALGLPDALISGLILHGEDDIRYPALKLGYLRPGLADALIQILSTDDDEHNQARAAFALVCFQTPSSQAAIQSSLEVPCEFSVLTNIARGLNFGLSEDDSKANATTLLRACSPEALRSLARWSVGAERGLTPLLNAWLAASSGGSSEAHDLREFGTELVAEARAGRLPRGHYLERSVEAALEVLDGGGRKAILLFGQAGVGKTAAALELVQRLAERSGDSAWHVLRLNPSDLLVGTKFIGEWETRVQALIDAIKAPRRVLLYITGIEGISTSGATSSDKTSLADLLVPHIESGKLAILGELTPESWQKSLGKSNALGRLFRRILIEPADGIFTRELLEIITLESEREVEDGFLDRLLELSDYHFSGLQLPGRAVGFLRQVIERVEEPRLEIRHLLQTLSQASGIPVDVLDDDKALDLEATREFLTQRVMGQASAVEHMLDLVTMVKAGLSDPEKPTGVMLFVGPTGVGKTELARALAELLFGSPERLLRFDMSEYASFQAYERLIGSQGESGILTQAIADKPFSILLLDEIEKSHQNVFDLCLQVFDAGRLTDGAGKTIDFRHTIIILTSNIGSAVPTEQSIGFDESGMPAPDPESIQRELGRFFRPEFLGRLDQIVHFTPLSAETADRIARREVTRMLARGGILRRGVSIDIDPAVFALLLREGYSPAFGARPLKRTVERRLLLPIARLLATGGAPRNAGLRVFVGSGKGGPTVQVSVITRQEQSPVPELPAGPLQLAALTPRLDLLFEQSNQLEHRKDELLENANSPRFWDLPKLAATTLDKIHRIENVLLQLAQLSSAMEHTADNPDALKQRKFIQRHELTLRRLEILFCAALEGESQLGDAFITITKSKGSPQGMDGVPMLTRMYRAFARRLGLECQVLSEHHEKGAGTEIGEVLLAIGGAGARELFQGEEGLHQFQREGPAERGKPERELLRVEVDPSDILPLEPQGVSFEQRPLSAQSGRLIERPRRALRLLHKTSLISVELWTDLDPKAARSELEAYLAARIQRSLGIPSDAPGIIRRYRFGTAPMVKDYRTGQSSGHLERVLRGELEPFFPSPSSKPELT